MLSIRDGEHGSRGCGMMFTDCDRIGRVLGTRKKNMRIYRDGVSVQRRAKKWGACVVFVRGTESVDPRGFGAVWERVNISGNADGAEAEYAGEQAGGCWVRAWVCPSSPSLPARTAIWPLSYHHTQPPNRHGPRWTTFRPLDFLSLPPHRPLVSPYGPYCFRLDIHT